MMQMKLIINGSVQQISFLREIKDYIEINGLHIVGELNARASGELEIIAQAPLEDLKSLHRFFADYRQKGTIRSIRNEFKDIKSPQYKKFSINTSL